MPITRTELQFIKCVDNYLFTNGEDRKNWYDAACVYYHIMMCEELGHGNCIVRSTNIETIANKYREIRNKLENDSNFDKESLEKMDSSLKLLEKPPVLLKYDGFRFRFRRKRIKDKSNTEGENT